MSLQSQTFLLCNQFIPRMCCTNDVTRMYVCNYVCMHACMYVYMYVCMHVCIYTRAKSKSYLHVVPGGVRANMTGRQPL